ncbi:MAG: NAD(P)/FAD-dependent oxidoreductase [Clostridia bacterium]|nr:NAD(P)/FAD-dependent oxidoreductase [Clostridia bacterium]
MVEIFPEIKYDIVVVGGGPAGIAAAIFAAREDRKVAVVEKNSCLGRKLCITGKGRCNITNNCDKEDFFANIPENPRFMYSPYSAFSNFDLIDFIEDLGVRTIVERGGRVFPKSGNAKEVRDALRDELKRLSVKVYYGCTVSEILTDDENNVTGVKLTENEMVLHSKAVIIATGGASYPGTGSTGDGYGFAEKLGHKVTDLIPALVGIETKETFAGELAGLTLKNCGIKFYEKGADGKAKSKIYEDFGEILFTHTGISGPTVLSGSFFINSPEKRNIGISIDLKPALDSEMLDARILRDFGEFSKRQFGNALSKLLPQSLIPVVVRLSGIGGNKPVSEISKKERARLVSLLKNFELTFKSLRPIDEAIITRGGVSVKDIDPKTMASKKVSGLYFAGEIIDVTGYTGGFNLTIAFSTGCLAGRSAAAFVEIKS